MRLWHPLVRRRNNRTHRAHARAKTRARAAAVVSGPQHAQPDLHNLRALRHAGAGPADRLRHRCRLQAPLHRPPLGQDQRRQPAGSCDGGGGRRSSARAPAAGFRRVPVGLTKRPHSAQIMVTHSKAYYEKHYSRHTHTQARAFVHAYATVKGTRSSCQVHTHA